jgi:peptidoglycan/LPS O-acetylase OafA/YrhL
VKASEKSFHPDVTTFQEHATCGYWIPVCQSLFLATQWPLFRILVTPHSYLFVILPLSWCTCEWQTLRQYLSRPSGHFDRLSGILNFGPLRSFGKYSYGIYVLHYPVVILLQMGGERITTRFSWLHSSGGLLLLRIVLGFGLSYAAALLSWNLLEKRVLQFKERFAYLPRREQVLPFQPNPMPDKNPATRLDSVIG